MDKNLCTIIAKNYISFARTLCTSFIENHPDGKCYVLIIDEFDGYIEEALEKFEIIKIDVLNIPKLREFCFKYNIVELSTALKPYFFRYLLDNRRIDKIIFLDPDILVLDKLNSIYDELNNNDILLTPHIDTDFPEDGLQPIDTTVMKHGVFNLGFIGLKKSINVDKFLLWWQSKLYNNCVIDYDRGYFVDQKYIDYAITLFHNIGIIYDTGYNVAYWNLHARRVHLENNEWRCNDGKLYFYHFSSYKPEKPESIAKSQTRFSIENMPELKQLFQVYTDKVNANGYLNSHKWPYTYCCFTNGDIILEQMRKWYRTNIATLQIENPFDLGQYDKKNGAIIKTIKYYKMVTRTILRIKASLKNR
jgi:hypothetical protein